MKITSTILTLAMIIAALGVVASTIGVEILSQQASAYEGQRNCRINKDKDLVCGMETPQTSNPNSFGSTGSAQHYHNCLNNCK